MCTPTLIAWWVIYIELRCIEKKKRRAKREKETASVGAKKKSKTARIEIAHYCNWHGVFSKPHFMH